MFTIINSLKLKIEKYGLLILTFGSLFLFFIVERFPEQSDTVVEYLIKFSHTVINFFIVSDFLHSLVLVLLGITIPIFVLTVTLVGRAAKIAKLKKSDQIKVAQKKKKERIQILQDRISNEPDNVQELDIEVSALKQVIKKHESNLKFIEFRYDSLGFRCAVVKPVIAFVLALFTYSLLPFFNFLEAQVVLLIVSVWCMFYGAKRLFITLQVVQEVSLAADDAQEKELKNFVSERLVGGLVEAFKIMEKEKEPMPQILFKSLPLELKNGQINTVKFHVNLAETGAKEADDVEIFIAVDESIQIQADSSYKIVKQDASYIPIRANSVFYKSSHMKRNTNYKWELKLKPSKKGTFDFNYSVQCRGHDELTKMAKVIVKD